MQQEQSDSSITCIVIEGGPCGGKSTFMARAVQYLQSRGYRVLVVPEAATELINAGMNPVGYTAFEFQKTLLCLQLLREEQYVDHLKATNDGRPCVLLLDRGAVGGMAYMDPHEFCSLVESLSMRVADLYGRYDQVLHLVTAAIGAEEFYTTDDNKARRETLEEARALDYKTRLVWAHHTNRSVIDNTGSFEEKIKRTLNAMRRVLGMGEGGPLEIERKWVVQNFATYLIPQSAVEIHIEQHYLLPPEGSPNEVHRVRSRQTLDGTLYFHTIKSDTDRPGVRIERERKIAFSEFRRLVLNTADPACKPIRKTRYCFDYAGRHLELDVFKKPKFPGRALLEIELNSMNEDVVLPEGWDMVEVTDDSRYSNRSIAEYGFPAST